MGLFSKTSLLGKIWGGIKTGVTAAAKAVASVFEDVEIEYLPEAITITEDAISALDSAAAEDVAEILNPVLAGIPEKFLAEAKVLAPKILSSELGLQALGATPTLAEGEAWAQSVIQAYGSASALQKSKIYSTLLTSLVTLFNQGKAENATWLQWANLADQALQQTKAAIAAANASPAAAAPSTTSTPAT